MDPRGGLDVELSTWNRSGGSWDEEKNIFRYKGCIELRLISQLILFLSDQSPIFGNACQ